MVQALVLAHSASQSDGSSMSLVYCWLLVTQQVKSNTKGKREQQQAVCVWLCILHAVPLCLLKLERELALAGVAHVMCSCIAWLSVTQMSSLHCRHVHILYSGAPD